MPLDTVILVGVLFACGVYLVLQRSLVRALFGFIILANAACLVLLAMSGDPQHKRPPVLSDTVLPMVDPLPQALILTAVVIGFGVTSYLVVLLYRIFHDHRTADAAELSRSHPPEEP
jgi:multicomponent Na+:H+ antiporter subunit C